MPIGVFALDQIDLPLAVPSLQLLFTCNGEQHFSEHFIADEMDDTVAAGEAGNAASTVFVEPAHKIGGHTNIQRTTRLAGEDIDARLLLERHKVERAGKLMLKQVQHDARAL